MLGPVRRYRKGRARAALRGVASPSGDFILIDASGNTPARKPAEGPAHDKAARRHNPLAIPTELSPAQGRCFFQLPGGRRSVLSASSRSITASASARLVSPSPR